MRAVYVAMQRVYVVIQRERLDAKHKRSITGLAKKSVQAQRILSLHTAR